MKPQDRIQDRIQELEAQLKTLTEQNAELLKKLEAAPAVKTGSGKSKIASMAEVAMTLLEAAGMEGVSREQLGAKLAYKYPEDVVMHIRKSGIALHLVKTLAGRRYMTPAHFATYSAAQAKVAASVAEAKEPIQQAEVSAVAESAAA